MHDLTLPAHSTYSPVLPVVAFIVKASCMESCNWIAFMTLIFLKLSCQLFYRQLQPEFLWCFLSTGIFSCSFGRSPREWCCVFIVSSQVVQGSLCPRTDDVPYDFLIEKMFARSGISAVFFSRHFEIIWCSLPNSISSAIPTDGVSNIYLLRLN